MTRARVAAAAATLLAVAGGAGAAGYLASEGDPAPPTTTTSTTSTTSTTLATDAVRDAIAATLVGRLSVTVTPSEAVCLAGVVVSVVPVDELQALAASLAPLSAVGPARQEELVRGVVGCVPAATAVALLGDPTTTTVPLDLPDEGSG
jgi:hypothetical protein